MKLFLLPWQVREGKAFSFTYLETVFICLSNGPIHFGLLTLILLQGWVEYSWGNCSFSLSNIIKVAEVESHCKLVCKWAPPSEFVSSSIPSWQTLTAHAQPFRGARDLAFCLKVPLDSLLVWASSGGSGETARMRRLAWTFAARIGDKYQIRLTRSK